ncbi:MAG: phage integrase N-terminal SAM-like domain-containing protein [Deltaproteobacteria bacterium]|nr:phage integrase N-terminal SAM-like domain-containing protein [Deltaproteobacteria bacterium]
MSTQNDRKLLDEVCEIMRLRHYSIHTERTCCDRTKKFVRFHGMHSRDDLKDGEKKIEAFLTHLAVNNESRTPCLIIRDKYGVPRNREL